MKHRRRCPWAAVHLSPANPASPCNSLDPSCQLWCSRQPFNAGKLGSSCAVMRAAPAAAHAFLARQPALCPTFSLCFAHFSGLPCVSIAVVGTRCNVSSLREAGVGHGYRGASWGDTQRCRPEERGVARRAVTTGRAGAGGRGRGRATAARLFSPGGLPRWRSSRGFRLPMFSTCQYRCLDGGGKGAGSWH